MAENEKKEIGFWKVFFAVIFFPIFLIWLVWSKTTWRAYVKGLATGVILLFAFGATAAISNPRPQNPTPAVQQNEQKPGESSVTTKELKVTEPIVFETQTRDDGTLAKGTTRTQQEGVNGIKVSTYKVTYTNGKETKRALISEVVTAQPVSKIVLNGTYVYVAPAAQAAPKVSSSCDPNYTGACVPIASDVDCAGGSGNGPAYVRGPVYVKGSDIYDLDRNGDGVGCE